MDLQDKGVCGRFPLIGSRNGPQDFASHMMGATVTGMV